MRKVDKTLADAPAIFSAQKTLDQWEEIAKNNPHLIDAAIYKDSYRDSEGRAQSRVRDKLNEIYFGKCAYCETLCKAEIEHYRPKKAITKTSHEGYYWLCYEWSNLVPSCRYCNTEGGKGNYFPVSGIRVNGPEFLHGKLDKSKCSAHQSPLKEEQPLLLHPEIDDPSQHLEFCWDPQNEGIRIKEKAGSLRGKSTIEICNLNRQDLRVERLKIVVDPLKQQIDYVFTLVKKGILEESKLPEALKILFEEIEEKGKDAKAVHILLTRHLHSSAAAFEEILGSYIKDVNQNRIVVEAYRQYKNGNL